MNDSYLLDDLLAYSFRFVYCVRVSHMNEFELLSDLLHGLLCCLQAPVGVAHDRLAYKEGIHRVLLHRHKHQRVEQGARRRYAF